MLDKFVVVSVDSFALLRSDSVGTLFCYIRKLNLFVLKISSRGLIDATTSHKTTLCGGTHDFGVLLSCLAWRCRLLVLLSCNFDFTEVEFGRATHSHRVDLLHDKFLLVRLTTMREARSEIVLPLGIAGWHNLALRCFATLACHKFGLLLKLGLAQIILDCLCYLLSDFSLKCGHIFFFHLVRSLAHPNIPLSYFRLLVWNGATHCLRSAHSSGLGNLLLGASGWMCISVGWIKIIRFEASDDRSCQTWLVLMLPLFMAL